MPGSQSRFALALLALGLPAICGCALVRPVADVFTFWPATPNAEQSPKQAARPSREVFQLEVAFVERSATDPFWENCLWKQMDPLGAVDTDERESLKRLGLRVGDSGATPCPALQRMLRKTADPLDAAEAKKYMPVVVRTLFLQASEEMPIETNSVSQCQVDVPTLTDSTEKTFRDFTGVLQLAVHHMSEGWARMEFVPEIRHDDKGGPAATTAAGGIPPAAPQPAHGVDRLVGMRFSVALHVGEMVVITADPNHPKSFGHHSFVADDPDKGSVQRLLIVRLANISRIDATPVGESRR